MLLTLNQTVNQGITLEDRKRITALPHIVSFNYELYKGDFFIRLLFKNTNVTNSYSASRFDNLFFKENTQVYSTQKEKAITLPTQKEIDKSQKTQY